MPLQNRVTPEGEIIATPARGLMMGNRGGRLHRPDKTLTARRWTSRAWIACRLEFNNRHRRVMSPNSYTELFFLDEATALAAGHRPCFECRRQDFMAFAQIWAGVDDGSERARVGGNGPSPADRTHRPAAQQGYIHSSIGSAAQRHFCALEEQTSLVAGRQSVRLAAGGL